MSACLGSWRHDSIFDASAAADTGEAYAGVDDDAIDDYDNDDGGCDGNDDDGGGGDQQQQKECAKGRD